MSWPQKIPNTAEIIMPKLSNSYNIGLYFVYCSLKVSCSFAVMSIFVRIMVKWLNSSFSNNLNFKHGIRAEDPKFNPCFHSTSHLKC